MVYLNRAVDAGVSELLSAMGGVLLEGARGCGKTSTGLHHAHSDIRLDTSAELRQLASLNPGALLQGAVPRLVDEWQLAPDLWNVVRHEIDTRQLKGQFILSGSSTPPEDPSRHSGAGRIGRIRMRTMSLAENGQSTHQVSLADMREGAAVSGTSTLTYRQLADLSVTGGWPGLLNATPRQALAFNRSYCEDLCATEIQQGSGVRHDPIRMRRLLASVARNISGEATMQSLASDVAGDGASFTAETARRYLDSLAAIFVYEELPAWSVALRSKSRLRSSAKLHFVDPALACAALNINSERLAGDPEFFGQVFESMVVRDLRALASADGGVVYHYRDNTGLEIDAIIEYTDGSWAAIEVKLGNSRVSQAEKNLMTLRDARVDTDKVGAPSFLAVITGTEHAYTLPSGVHVIPLGVLGA